MQCVGQGLLNGFRRIQLVALGAGFQLAQQMPGRFNAGIAGQQQRLQILEQLVIDLATGENRFQLAAKLGTGPGKSGLESLAPRGGGGGTGDGVVFGRRFFQETKHARSES